MTGIFLFGTALIISCFLLQQVKSVFRRKWLGIVLGGIGFIGVVATPASFEGFDPFSTYLVMWFTGMTLFFDRNRYSATTS